MADTESTKEKKPDAAETSDKLLLYLKAKGITATGYESRDGFVVLADSQAVAGTVPSIPDKLMKWRNDLIQEKILIKGHECLVLTQNHVFPSASAAAGIMLGRSVNGRVEWKDVDGRTLKAIQNSGKSLEEVLKSKLKRIERKIAGIEGFDVTIKYHGDTDTLPSYDFERAANRDLTVAQWRNQRFMRIYPDCEVAVRFADESEAHGATRLARVRDSYADE